MKAGTRYWVACGDYRQPVAKERIEQAREFFTGCYPNYKVLILKDGDPKLKDFMEEDGDLFVE